MLTEMKKNNIRALCAMKHIKPQLFTWVKKEREKEIFKGISLLKLVIIDETRECCGVQILIH